MKYRLFALVVLAAGSLRAQTPHPAVGAKALREYVDPETGVSLQYPARWTAAGAEAYGTDPMLRDVDPSGKAKPKIRLQRGWRIDAPAEVPSESIGTSVSFRYALLRPRNARSCRTLFDSWESEGKPEDILRHGVRFHHVTYENAGLGHSWNFDVYTTFHEGRCLGFSLGMNTSHVDEAPRSTKADKRVSLDTEAVFASLRLLPEKQELK